MENLVFTQLSVSEVRKMLNEEVRTALQDLIPTLKHDDSTELMTIQEVARLINMAVQSVYGMVHQRRIPFIKRGKRLIFERKQIIDWLQAGRNKTLQEITQEIES